MPKKSKSGINKAALAFVVFVVLALGGLRLLNSLQGRHSTAQVNALGKNKFYQLGGPNKNKSIKTFEPLAVSAKDKGLNFISAKAGLHFTVLLTNKGDVYAMGSNSGKAISAKSIPAISTLQKVDLSSLENDEKIVSIDSSRDHIIALSNFGNVYTWGSNYTAQLGDGTNDNRTVPKKVSGLPKISQVAAGYRHSVAITNDGKVYAWGGVCEEKAMAKAQDLINQASSNIDALGGYIADDHAALESDSVADCTTLKSTFVQSRSPKELKGVRGKATQISAGYGHLMVLNDKGEVFTAGCNTFLQLGRYKKTGSDKNDLAMIELSAKAVQVSAGYRHSAIAMEDMTARMWGYNYNDSLRVNSANYDPIQTPLKLYTDQKIVVIEAAHDSTFAITEDKKVIGWGKDDAKAFWPANDGDSFMQFGRLSNTDVKLSAGMEHLLLSAGS